MGVALYNSSDPYDQKLWRDWYDFTVDLASKGCFAEDETERKMAREFVGLTIDAESCEKAFSSHQDCLAILKALEPSPEHFFWFEYNFLYVLAAELGGQIKIHSETILPKVTNKERDFILSVIRAACFM